MEAYLLQWVHRHDYIHINLRQQQKVDKVLHFFFLPIKEKSELNSGKLFERFYFPQKKFERFDFTTILKTYIIWVYTYIKRNI